MLSALKILLIVVGLPALALGFFIGGPFMIVGLVALGGAVAIDRLQAQQRTGGPVTSGKRALWSVVVLVLGGGAYLAITSLGALGNLDTTGTASPQTTLVAIAVAALVVILGLIMVNRPRAS